MKKSIALFLLIFVLIFSMAACGEKISQAEVELQNVIKEYDEFADKFVDLVKRFKANPTDASVLAEMNNFSTEANEFKVEIQEKLANINSNDIPKEKQQQYLDQITAINEKITNAASDILGEE